MARPRARLRVVHLAMADAAADEETLHPAGAHTPARPSSARSFDQLHEPTVVFEA